MWNIRDIIYVSYVILYHTFYFICHLDIRRRIELIQDFSMPGLSTTVKMTQDNKYILATGIYKPRVRCYEVNNLSLKFERCFDSEVITFQAISEDYTKVRYF